LEGLPVYTPKEVAENYLSTCRAKAALPLGLWEELRAVLRQAKTGKNRGK
jgi:hypothetical protein